MGLASAACRSPKQAAKMRVVHICTIPTGAAYRLHAGLRRLGVDSAMVVAEIPEGTDDPTLVLFRPPGNFPNRIRRRLVRTAIARDFGRYRSTRPDGTGYFFDDRSPHGGDIFPQLPPCDVIHLHTMLGLTDFRAFFARVRGTLRVVRTLHDMSFFTGGCHQDWGCGRFRERCGACPQLGSRDPNDLSRQVWRRKHAALSAVPPDRFHLVAPSRWIAEMADASSLLRGFPITVIPLGLDTETFCPRDRRLAREMLGIPTDVRVVLFVASPIARPEKGFALLAQALDRLAPAPNLLLISVGRGAPPVKVKVPHRHLGFIGHPAFLAVVYSAADVVVVPSIQDTFPQACIEALACGVPVIGFAVGGIPEMVRPGVTGVLVPPGDSDRLGNAIADLLQDSAGRAQLAINSRRIAVEEYTVEQMARRHRVLYEEVLHGGQAATSWTHPGDDVASSVGALR